MFGLGHDIRYALRAMRRNLGVTIVAVTALGLGIGANTAVFTVIHGVMLRPLPLPDSDRLVLLSNTPARGMGRGVGLSESDYLELRRRGPAFQSVSTFNRDQVTLTGAGEPVRLRAARVTPEFFKVVKIAPRLGRPFRDREEHAVILGEGLWQSRFGGDRAIAGKPVRLDGEIYTVTGVMPAAVDFPNEAEVWLPLEIRLDPHAMFFRPVVARLLPGQSREEAQGEFTAFARGLDAERGTARTKTVPRVLALKEYVTGGVRDSLKIFAAAVCFVLLIACANVANLLLMRAASRSEEMGVRVALGAARGRLVRQLLTESLLLGALGGVAGILIASWGVPALLALAPEGWIPRLSEIRIDTAVLAFTMAASVFAGLLFGLFPALQAAFRSVPEQLGRAGRVAGGGGALRNMLAVAEIAMALVLLTGAGLLMRSLWRLHAVDPGFHADRVLTMTIDLPPAVYRAPSDMKSFDARLLENLRSGPGVSAAAAVSALPLSGFLTRGDVTLRDRRFPPGYAVDKLVVSANYFLAMGIRLLSGRDFRESDKADAPRVAIVSRSVGQTLWEGGNPLGRQISEQDHPQEKDWYTVIGVVDDIRQAGLAEQPSGGVYFCYPQSPHDGWLQHMTFVVRTDADSSAAAAAMRSALHAVDADEPAGKIISMEGLMVATGSARAFQARLLAVFALLAVSLAVIGIYGVLAYGVASRTREIGIRVALGARTEDVMRMVMKRTLLLAAGGLALGIAGALFATRALATMLYDVKPNDAPTIAGVAAMVCAVTLAAGWIPARRAAKVDPLIALRWE